MKGEILLRHIFNASLLILLLIGSRAFALDYSPLVINEVDYNQSEYNKSAQFVEFKNTTTRSLSLAGYALELYDTANLPVDFEHPKMTLNLSADVTLEPGGYYVICRSQAVSSLSSAECDRFAPNDMVILPWDGPRGGLRLVFGEGENMEVVDSLSWGQYVEGLTEGTTPAPLDKTTKADYALSRVPTGHAGKELCRRSQAVGRHGRRFRPGRDDPANRADRCPRCQVPRRKQGHRCARPASSGRQGRRGISA